MDHNPGQLPTGCRSHGAVDPLLVDSGTSANQVAGEGPGAFGIGIPLYNGAQTIAATLQSLISQTDERWRAWVVDDASVDDSIDAVAPFLDDDRIELVPNPHNVGMTANWNRALEAARGEFLITLGHDDTLIPTALSIVRQHFERVPDAGFVAFGAAQDRGEMKVFEPRKVLGTIGPDELVRLEVELVDNPPPSEVVYRGEVLAEVGHYDEAFRYCPEVDLQIRIALAGHPAVFLHDPLVIRGVGPQRVTAQVAGTPEPLEDYYELARRYGGTRVRRLLLRRGLRSAAQQMRRGRPGAAAKLMRATVRGDISHRCLRPVGRWNQ